jgi:histidinol-phosphatase (PHP family)
MIPFHGKGDNPLIDLHIHSAYSGDGSMPLETICEQAIAAGLTTIAITDHVDGDWPDHTITFNISDIDKYLREITEMEKQYEGRLRVLKGIEIGLQPHLLDETRKYIETHPFDYVIASVHLADGLDPYDAEYFEGRTKEESLRRYYQAVLDLIQEYDAFDTLGHLDYVRRSCPYPIGPEDDAIELIDEILRVLIQKNKALEINSSGLRTPLQETLPSPGIGRRFLAMGGKYLTFGSDAHRAEDIGHGLDYVRKHLGADAARFVYYQNRMPHPAGL